MREMPVKITNTVHLLTKILILCDMHISCDLGRFSGVSYILIECREYQLTIMLTLIDHRIRDNRRIALMKLNFKSASVMERSCTRIPSDATENILLSWNRY
jgi:hypothetical protein